MFITFEGIDGAGKTTQAKMLCEYLNSIGKKAVFTKEPGGGGEFSLKIRELLINYKTDQLTDLFAIYAARNEHIQNTVLPSLSNGYIVVCDRFIDSTIAYFCYNKDKEEYQNAINLINTMQKYVANSLMPDKTFLIDISYENATKRLGERLFENDNKYDNFNKIKYDNIMNIYYTLQKNEPKRIQLIDGNRQIDLISQEICSSCI